MIILFKKQDLGVSQSDFVSQKHSYNEDTKTRFNAKLTTPIICLFIFLH